MNQRQIKKIPREQVEKKPVHPLYNVLTQQISAAVLVVRQMDAEKQNFALPDFAQRFLDDYGRKSA